MTTRITPALIPDIATRLPAFPRVVPELLDRLQSDTISVDSLVHIARQDSVIAAAILSAANGLRRLRAQPDTADLFAAASLIGTNKLKQIIVRIGLNKLLSEGSGQAFFFEHSLAVAIVSQELAQLVPGVSPDEAYIAGILHDIGSWRILSSMPRPIVVCVIRPLAMASCWRTRLPPSALIMPKSGDC